MRDTKYATELKRVADNHGQRIERLYVKEKDRHEIRFSYWKDDRMVVRPLDLPEDELLDLMKAALAEGVFTDRFAASLLRTIAEHIEQKTP